MADDHRATSEFLQRFLERAQRIDSRSLVGSSSSKRLAPDRSILARSRGALSAGKLTDFFSAGRALEVECRAICARIYLFLPKENLVVAVRDFLPNGFMPAACRANRSNSLSSRTCRPRFRRRLVFLPVIIRNRVVLPAPFGPMTPTISPGGNLKVRSSIRSVSPNPCEGPRSRRRSDQGVRQPV